MERARSNLPAAILILVLVGSFLLKLNHLGHTGVKALDESFHAVVARNLLKHPLTPTLYDKPYLPYDYRDWQNNHIWLHKPIVPLWQMALSMALFGANTLAMRLPSAILATASVWLTFLIGRRLLDWRAALIGAALQALNPAITALVHGYVFSDHVDTAFLFWVELSVYLLVRAIQSGSICWIITAGIAQGVAYLCKTYPAFVVTGMAVVACFLSDRFRPRHVLILLTATLVTVAPWTIYCMVKFPREFWWEQAQVFRHLDTNVEGWAAPWDRLIFDFSLRIYDVLYPSVVVAAIILAPRAWREKSIGVLVLLAWGLGVLVPHVLATSKTPAATLIGWPPFFLLFGAMVARALDGEVTCLIGWTVATVLASVARGRIPQVGWGYPDPPGFAVIARQNIWILYHTIVAVAAAFLIRIRFPRSVHTTLLVIASIATLFLATRTARLTWRVTQNNRDWPALADLGSMVRVQAPANAVLLLESREKCEQIIAMFHTERTVYPVSPQSIQSTADRITAAGGLPLLVTDRRLPLPRVFDQAVDGRYVYTLPTTPAAPTTSP